MRLQARDRSTAEDARARMRSQKTTAEKVAVADFVIDNVGRAELAAKTDATLAAIAQRLGVDVGRYPCATPTPTTTP